MSTESFARICNVAVSVCVCVSVSASVSVSVPQMAETKHMCYCDNIFIHTDSDQSHINLCLFNSQLKYCFSEALAKNFQTITCHSCRLLRIINVTWRHTGGITYYLEIVLHYFEALFGTDRYLFFLSFIVRGSGRGRIQLPPAS